MEHAPSTSTKLSSDVQRLRILTALARGYNRLPSVWKGEKYDEHDHAFGHFRDGVAGRQLGDGVFERRRSDAVVHRRHGGAYLLVHPGELRIELFKRDRNVLGSRGTELRAILAAPDRQVLADVTIPSTRGSTGDPPSPVQRQVLSVQVERPGIYALNITTRDDRHGLNIEWAFETNAAAWVIETSRGHRDERHREPIVLTDAGRSADVNFLPRAGRFEIEIEGLPPDAEPLTLYDEHGQQVAQIPVTAQRSTSIRQYMGIRTPDQAEGSARYTVAADQRRGNRPWRLHFPQAQALLEIDGLTRWDSSDLYRDHCVWTPRAESWFPWMEHRWLISPYQRTVYAPPGEQGQMTFVVHNNSPAAAHRRAGTGVSRRAVAGQVLGRNARTVTLDARSQAEIELDFQSPERWAAADLSRAGDARGSSRSHYLRHAGRRGRRITGGPTAGCPSCCNPMRTRTGSSGTCPNTPSTSRCTSTCRTGHLSSTGRRSTARPDGGLGAHRSDPGGGAHRPDVAAGAWSASGSKVAFDSENHVYLIGRSGALAALLRSTDGGQTFTAFVIPGREQRAAFVGHRAVLRTQCP
jgi:hypothetical protein